MFQQHYPSCKSAKVVADPMTNVSRGYGFVRFSDELEQQRALQEMQGQYCGYRPIRISIATPKGRDRMPGGLGMPAGLGPGLGLMYSTLHSQPYNQFTDPNNTTVFVGGLSPLATEDELKRYVLG